MHEDGEVHPVVGNLGMVARGQTIIGYDRHGQTGAIYNPEGDVVFQNRGDRTTRTVTYEVARLWGVLDPSPSDPDLPPEMYRTPNGTPRLSARVTGFGRGRGRRSDRGRR